MNGRKMESRPVSDASVRLVITMLAITAFAVLASGLHVPVMAAPADVAPTWGEVLIAGGNGPAYFTGLSSTELYDPASNTFATAGNTATMNYGRYSGTATLLASGKVLIAGGVGGGIWLSSTDLYDPATNSFAAADSTATMNTGRYAQTATLLASGKVLIAGGYSNLVGYLSSTELYDPASNSFAAASGTATMNTARYDATATLLASGKVLIVGGFESGSVATSSTELYDPASNSFAAPGNTAAMNTARSDATATLLASGKVLIAGGYDDNSGAVYSSTELYDPATNSFAAVGDTATMNTGRFGARATLLPSGKVLIAGGYANNTNFPVLSSTELYDPATNSFAAVGNTATMNAGRADAIPTLLPSGKVLIEGGYDSSNNALSSTELYDPATNSFASAVNTPTMNSARGGATVVLLPQPCTATYNGTFNGNLNISSGLTCIIGGTVTGNVTQNGGQLITSSATIGGNLQITGGGSFSMASTHINGDVQIQNIPAGSAQNQICGTQVKGNLTFHNNGTAVAIGTTSGSCPGDTIGNDLQVNNNTAAVQVFGDSVGGNLQCGNNSTITGNGDTAKSLQGQCASF